MYKNILISFSIFFFTACSQNEPEPKQEVKKEIIEPNKEVVTQKEVTPIGEFIPEHIRRSRIEVVKHY